MIALEQKSCMKKGERMRKMDGKENMEEIFRP